MNYSHVSSCGIRVSKDWQLRVPYTCPTAPLYEEPTRQLFYLYASKINVNRFSLISV
jgi:hypothetical protein